jgi:DNA-binding beta-propeller fold protein YncE
MLEPERKRWVLAAVLALATCVACRGSRPAAPPSKTPATPESPVESAAAQPVPTALAFAPPPPQLVRDVGLEQPACVLYDAALDVYLVSNVNGDASARDGNGFISRLGPDGNVLELSWIQGGANGVTLDAPRGLAIAGDKLYVADIDTVRVFERTTGKPAGKLAFGPAFFVSDVASAPAGDVLYVAERGGAKPGQPARKAVLAAIYAFDGATSRLLRKGAELGEPAALAADDDGVWVVAKSGALYRVRPDGTQDSVTQLPERGLTGLVRTRGGRLLVASAGASAVYVGKPEGPFEAFATELQAPGDIGYDERRSKLLVPLGADDAVYVQPVPGE